MDYEKAQDLMQVTMLKAYRFLEKFESGTNFKAWVMMIMKNSFINDYRKARTEPTHVSYTQDEQEFILEYASRLSHDNRDFEMSDELVVALNRLPAEWKEIVIMSDVQGIPHYEIAEHLGLTNGTVKSRLHRCHKRLLAMLEDHGRSIGYEFTGKHAPPIRKYRNRMQNPKN